MLRKEGLWQKIEDRCAKLRYGEIQLTIVVVDGMAKLANVRIVNETLKDDGIRVSKEAEII